MTDDIGWSKLNIVYLNYTCGKQNTPKGVVKVMLFTHKYISIISTINIVSAMEVDIIKF